MDKPRLLFVHKDQKSKSLSSSSGAERKQIYRHVHIGHSKKPTQKLKKIERLPDYDETDLAVVTKDGEKPKVSAEGWQNRSSGSSRQRLVPTAIQGSPPEPFDVLTVPLDQETFVLLQFFEHISHPRTWYPESRMSRGQLQSQDPPSMVIQSCLEDEMTTRTMLATSATQMRHLMGHTSTLDDAILISRALTAMKKYVSSCRKPDQRLITGILFLAFAECYRQAAEAARTHMCTVKRLSDQLGGLAALQPHLQWWALAADELITAQLLPAKPLFAATHVDPGALDGPSKIDLNGCHTANSNIFAAAWVDQIPDGLLQALSELIDCLPELEFVFSGESEGEDKNVQGLQRWVHSRMWSIRARLLALDAEEPRAKVTKLALLVWVYTLAPAGRRMTAQSLARRLKEEINLAGKAIYGLSGDLHMWILVVGALGSVGIGEERGWYIRHIIDTYQSLHPDSRRERLTEQDLKSMLSRVLYLEAVHGRMLADLAAELRIQTS